MTGFHFSKIGKTNKTHMHTQKWQFIKDYENIHVK